MNASGDEHGSHQHWGAAAEQHSRYLAATFGVPDFVYLPRTERKGRSSREISDGLLVCGDDGLILQVKARDPRAKDDSVKAARWILKHAASAARQAEGTRKRLQAQIPITLPSLRGFGRTFDSVGDWPAVVVLEHPCIPDSLQLPFKADVLWVTLDDWYALNERLRSTASVIAYVRRALCSGLLPNLGEEEQRYLALALADDRASDGPDSVPALPRRSLNGEDKAYAALVSDLIEQVWPPDGVIPWKDPDEYRLIVERIDRIPPAGRARLGRKMLDTFQSAVASSYRRSFLFYDDSQELRICFLYDVIRSENEIYGLGPDLTALTLVRQEQAIESGAAPHSVTLGVGVHHCPTRGRQYTFTYMGEPLPSMPRELRYLIEDEFGVFDGTTIRSVS